MLSNALRKLLGLISSSVPRRRHRRTRRPRCYRPQLQPLEDRTLPATVFWVNPNDGNWDVPGNWSTGALPTAVDDVVIDIPDIDLIVTHPRGGSTIRSLTSREALVLSGGSLSIAAESVIDRTFSLSGGTLTGTGTVIVNDMLTWTGGTMSGPGRTIANGGLDLSGTGTKVLSSRALDNAGTATWIETAPTVSRLQFSGGTFNNLAGATFIAEADSNLSGPGTFNNAGTFRRAAVSGVSQLFVPFTNTGQVEVQGGTLRLSGGSAGSGTYTAAAGATLDFSTGVHNLSPGSSVSGDGTVRFITLTGGVSTANVLGSYAVTGNTVIQTATVNLFTDVTFPSLTLQGTLAGPGDVTVTGLFTWNGGIMSGPGRTQANGGIVTGEFQGNTLIGRTLDNAGTAVWRERQFTLVGGAVFNNLPGASFLLETPAFIGGIPLGSGTLNNAGILIKSASVFNTTVSTTFVNSGAVEVRSGGLVLNAVSTSSGSYEVGAGARLIFGAGNHHLTPASSVTGAGAVQFWAETGSTGTTTVAGTYDVGGTTDVNNGTANFVSGARTGALNLGTFGVAGGTLTGPGDLTVTGRFTWIGGTLSGPGRLLADGGMDIIRLEIKRWDGRPVDNAGPATWSGGNLPMGNGVVFNNREGATFDIQGDVNLLSFGAAPRINNAGTLRKSGGTGATAFNSVLFNNTGAVEVQRGTLSLAGGGASSGSFTAEAGATLTFNTGVHFLGLASSVTGAGIIRFANDTGSAFSTVQVAGTYDVSGSTVIAGNVVEFFGDVRFGTLTQSAGVLTVPGTLTTTGLLTWTGGIMSGPGLTRAEGGMALSGSERRFLDGRRLENAATATLSATGEFLLQNGAMLANLAGATLVIESTFPIASISGLVPSAFLNAGLVRKAVPGTTLLNIPFHNSGILDVQAGLLQLAREASNDGEIVVAQGAVLEIGTFSIATSFDLGPSSRVTGAGTVNLRRPTVVRGEFDIARVNLLPFSRVDFQSDARIGTANFGDGFITGPGTVTVTDLLDWSGTVMTGTGRTVVTGRTNLGGGNTRMLDGRTFDNAGTFTLGGFSGGLLLRNGAVFNNLPGAVFDRIAPNVGLFIDVFDRGPVSTFRNEGTFRNSAIAGVDVPFAFVNTGVVDVRQATLILRGPFTNFDRASGTLSGGTYLVRGTFLFLNADIRTNGATIVLDGPASRIVNQAGDDALGRLSAITADGGLTLQGGRSLSTSEPFSSEGSLALGPGSTFTAPSFSQSTGTTTLSGGTLTAATIDLQGGVLTGAGTINGSVINAARLIVGGAATTGLLTINGNYTQTSAGSLDLELGGTMPGEQFDWLQVSGAATLDGSLNIALQNGYFPNPGDSFLVLTFSSRDGSFAAINGLDIGGGLFLNPLLDDTGLTLVATILP